jgi:hypothetical protein
MTKLEHKVGDAWVAYCAPSIYRVDAMSADRIRVLTTAPAGDPAIFRALCTCLEAPFFLLYILHTPRGEGEPGRYQSQEIGHSELAVFLTRFGDFLANDGRFDIWAYAPTDNQTVVWDRHDQIFAYGARDCYEAVLKTLGFVAGEIPALGEHIHHYRQEYDADATVLLDALNWIRTPLRPSDEQFV